MSSDKLHILLCDDSDDDRFFFKTALDQVKIETRLDEASDGEQLMDWLSEHKGEEPDVIFLDLNMPRKNGFECLQEMNDLDLLQRPVVLVYSTADDKESIDRTYGFGAHLYIVKPSDFSKLQPMIETALSRIKQNNYHQPPRENFVLKETVIA